MFDGSFGTQNAMVTFIFIFDPRKGQCQVKLGQISRFKTGFQKLTVQFFLRILKMSSILEYDKYTCPKLRFKSDVIRLSVFFGLAKSKIKKTLC